MADQGSGDVARLVPEGTAPPADVPPEIFQAAMATFLAGKRLDMQALAADLGISRSTLYRKAGDRDRLLGVVIWYLARRAIVPALEQAQHLEGRTRITTLIGGFMHWLHDQTAFQALLANEPEAALRVLTSKHGFVQGALVELTEQLLHQEIERGTLAPTIDPGSLAYVIVRIGESFLYADVIAHNDLDLDEAVALVGRLLEEPEPVAT